MTSTKTSKKMTLAAMLLASALALPALAQTRHAATITLDGNWYLQAGQVLNQSSDGIALTGFWYSMGAPQAGSAVWERYESGSQALDPLAGSDTHYSTAYWGGLNLDPGRMLRFGGLDLDRVETTAPLSIDNQSIDSGGGSLAHAYVEVMFSDGLRGRVALAQWSWERTQVLTIDVPAAPVPEPAPAAMLGAGVLALAAGARRRAASGAGD